MQITTKPNQRTEEMGWAEFLQKVDERIAEREALNPPPPKPPQPYVQKTGALIAAEKDLLRWEMCLKLQGWLCRDTAKCQDNRCRRQKRCRKLQTLATDLEASRLRLAAAQANEPSPVPSLPPLPSPRGRKKGRTGVRP